MQLLSLEWDVTCTWAHVCFLVLIINTELEANKPRHPGKNWKEQQRMQPRYACVKDEWQNDKCPLDRERESFVSTGGYHLESHNCLSDPSQKQPGETQRSTKRKWRRHAGFSSIIANAALLLPQQKLSARKQNSEPPAALEELLHGQPFRITFELGSSQMCVSECMCLIYDLCSSMAISQAIPADTRHTSGRCSPHLYLKHVVIFGSSPSGFSTLTWGSFLIRRKQPPQIHNKRNDNTYASESLILEPLHTVRVRVMYKQVLRLNLNLTAQTSDLVLEVSFSGH